MEVADSGSYKASSKWTGHLQQSATVRCNVWKQSGPFLREMKMLA